MFLDERVCIAPSPIHGQGAFARQDLAPDDVLDEGPGEDFEATEDDLLDPGVILVEGRLVGWTGDSWAVFLNHASPANLQYQRREDGFTYPVVTGPVAKGEELTLDYRECVHPKDPVYREMFGSEDREP